MLYDQKPYERIFPISKSYLHHEMDRGVKATGLKRIRIACVPEFLCMRLWCMYDAMISP